MRFRDSAAADLEIVATWVRTQRECELWAGPRVKFPLDVGVLRDQFDLEKAVSVSGLDERGLAAFGQLLAKSPQRLHLARVIVRPDARGCGAGRSLLGELLLRAAVAPQARVSLYVNRTNEAAIALYESLGFRHAARPVEDPPSATSWYMEREAPRSSVRAERE
jgi:ribosomal protein S18 acetylase RimI-like enzyme